MDLDDSSAAEQVILAVLTGTPITEVAARVHSSPSVLAEAVERYRSAGRATLDAQAEASKWYQANIEFADYPMAERAFFTCLMPALRTGHVAAWWFVRKYPCWRLRCVHGPTTGADDVSKPIDEALDRAVSLRAVTRWWRSPYEAETTAFGGPIGMDIAHDLFHADSVGVLEHLNLDSRDGHGFLDAKVTSLLVISQFLRAANQEWSEQGDVWARVEAARPLPDDVPVERVTAMTNRLQRLLAIDTAHALAAAGPLAPIAEWITGMERVGRALGCAGREGRLTLGTRSILARHVLFHWNRMGFTTRQQAIWSRAARETIFGR